MLHNASAQFSGRPRQVTLDGRSYTVRRVVSLVPGVLEGSKGKLYYPDNEVRNSTKAWDDIPITVNHPTYVGMPVSAKHPTIKPIGVLKASTFNGKLVHESWFDDEAVINADKEHGTDMMPRIKAGLPIECSTGLHTDDEPTPGVHNGRPYDAIARNYRPDHLAVLPTSIGACSVMDGCGINVNEANKGFVQRAIDAIVRNFFGLPRHQESGQFLNVKGSSQRQLDRAATTGFNDVDEREDDDLTEEPNIVDWDAIVGNAFCPTGPGGGIDSSCGGGGEGGGGGGVGGAKTAYEAANLAADITSDAAESSDKVLRDAKGDAAHSARLSVQTARSYSEAAIKYGEEVDKSGGKGKRAISDADHAHQTAMTGHKEAAAKLSRMGFKEEADKHREAYDAHGQARIRLDKAPGRGLFKSSVAKRNEDHMDRAATVNFLVTNCTCWKGKDKLLMNKDAFSDAELEQLKTNATLAINVAKNNLKFNADGSLFAKEEPVEEPVVPAKKKPPAEEPAVPAKPAAPAMNMKQWEDAMPPEARAIWNGVKAQANNASQGVIKQLQFVANQLADGDPRKALVLNEIKGGDVASMEKTLLLLDAGNGMRQPSYLGQGGAFGGVENAGEVNDDFLDLPTLNYADVASERIRKYDPNNKVA